MKCVTIRIENAVRYSEQDDRKATRILATGSINDPSPVPTETTVPEAADDMFLLQVVDTANGNKKVLALAVRGVIEARGDNDDQTQWALMADSTHAHFNRREKPEPKTDDDPRHLKTNRN